MLHLITWIIAGLIVGTFVRLFVPRGQSLTWLMTILLGMTGALLGGLFAWIAWGDPGEPFSQHAWPGYLLAIGGGIALLLLSRSSQSAHH